MKILIRASALALLLLPSIALATKEIYVRSKDKIAVRGYDVVSYFTQNSAVKGDSAYSFAYRGASWHFSSKTHLELFKSSPEKYVPQYGGYCAYAAAKSSKAASKPQFFTVYKDKLYLNFGKDVNDKWLRNKDDYIRDADQNWPSVLRR